MSPGIALKGTAAGRWLEGKKRLSEAERKAFVKRKAKRENRRLTERDRNGACIWERWWRLRRITPCTVTHYPARIAFMTFRCTPRSGRLRLGFGRIVVVKVLHLEMVLPAQHKTLTLSGRQSIAKGMSLTLEGLSEPPRKTTGAADIVVG